jgi:hypothetical protein
VFPPSPPTLCGHPHRCATIPGTAGSSPARWEPRSTGHRHACRCADSDPPSARPSNWCTDDDQTMTPAQPPSKPPLDRHKSYHDACRDEIHWDGHRITGTVRHAATQQLKSHSTIVNRLPLVYKRRRRPPSCGGRGIAHSLTFPPSLTILALASIRPQGLRGFSSSPALLVAPLYEHHGALQYSATSAPLLDVRPAARTRINHVS